MRSTTIAARDVRAARAVAAKRALAALAATRMRAGSRLTFCTGPRAALAGGTVADKSTDFEDMTTNEVIDPTVDIRP